jgi:hypothetical protein
MFGRRLGRMQLPNSVNANLVERVVESAKAIGLRSVGVASHSAGIGISHERQCAHQHARNQHEDGQQNQATD